MKHDIKSELSVRVLTIPAYYRKLGTEILTLDTVSTKGMTEEHRQLLCKQHFEYADKVEQEEKEALKMYKKRSYNRKRK